MKAGAKAAPYDVYFNSDTSYSFVEIRKLSRVHCLSASDIISYDISHHLLLCSLYLLENLLAISIYFCGSLSNDFLQPSEHR